MSTHVASIPLIDRQVPAKVLTATFAMGWFWGPDSQFGSLPGVVRTRVGYAGGAKAHPTYHDLGDHTECLEVDYDPEVLSYGGLLRQFWVAHFPTRPAWSTQYASLILTHDPDQEREARESLETARAGVPGGALYTDIRPLDRFWRAEDYHQKYYLRRHAEFAEELLRIYPNPDDFTDSTAAARLNGLLGGHGGSALVEKEGASYGLSEDRLRRLQAVVRRRP